MKFLKSLITVKALVAALLVIVLVLRPFAMYTAVKDSTDADAATVANMYIAIGAMSMLAVAIILFLMSGRMTDAAKTKNMSFAVIGLIGVFMILQIANLSMLKKAEAKEMTFNATLDLFSTIFVTLVVVSYGMNVETAAAADAVTTAAEAGKTAFGHFYY